MSIDVIISRCYYSVYMLSKDPIKVRSTKAKLEHITYSLIQCGWTAVVDTLYNSKHKNKTLQYLTHSYNVMVFYIFKIILQYIMNIKVLPENHLNKSGNHQ